MVRPLIDSSTQSALEFFRIRPAVGQNDEEDSDGGSAIGEVVNADVAGLIAGAAGAAAASFWSGVAVGASAVVGAAVGSVAGSAIEYLTQDASTEQGSAPRDPQEQLS
ncbi:hypothetical protein CKO25_07595 [Thiocapsa imhoffii]|uniref:Uncharacterized protein n=1 Tax=Thiocapsa imhoffii TaxID=382777 RepID=A0A9X0WGY6_9GAMM|nr:hypothetical protein [Thiocapsa imhoffii]MBK1644519.1 hypothetical protein [Thiocapsa imhoffii]